MIPERALDAAVSSIVSAIDKHGYIDADDKANVLIDIRDFDLVSAMRSALEAASLEQARDEMLEEKAREAKEEWADDRRGDDSE